MAKLTSDQKSALKAETRIYKAVFARCDRVTVCIIPTGNGRAKFGISIASPDEKKIRAKVGRWVALNRAIESGMPVELDNYLRLNLIDLANDLACVIST